MKLVVPRVQVGPKKRDREKSMMRWCEKDRNKQTNRNYFSTIYGFNVTLQPE